MTREKEGRRNRFQRKEMPGTKEDRLPLADERGKGGKKRTRNESHQRSEEGENRLNIDEDLNCGG